MNKPSKLSPAIPAFHCMTKPIGPICNLNCSYCFYLEKEQLFNKTENFKMSDETLEHYIRDYIEAQNVPEVHFAWQGGEPTLLGVEYFQKIVSLQERYRNGRVIHNAIQTNGTLLDDRWAEFLSEHRFLVGVSIDGPPELHDAYRVDKRDRATSAQVMRGIEVLKKHQVDFNTLTVVNRKNARHPHEVYRFLKELGSTFLQFIPIVERSADSEALAAGLDLGMPPDLQKVERNRLVTEWSVIPEEYGEFLVAIYNEWVRNDVGKTFVQFFDVALGNWLGQPGGLCVFSPECGTAMAVEHNGDVYSCDHYVYPKYKLGNLMNTSLREMVESDTQRQFGRDKRTTLPAYCQTCSVRFACHGECPKHRFMKTPDGAAGLNYLCPAYKRIFQHMAPTMEIMARCLHSRKAPATVMEEVAGNPELAPLQVPGRNDPCTCGSGKKFKRCCGK